MLVRSEISILVLTSAVADLHRKILDAPPGVQILSISCSFWENLAKIICWRAPPPEELAPPPRGNPGSATGPHTRHFRDTFNFLTGRVRNFTILSLWIHLHKFDYQGHWVKVNITQVTCHI